MWIDTNFLIWTFQDSHYGYKNLIFIFSLFLKKNLWKIMSICFIYQDCSFSERKNQLFANNLKSPIWLSTYDSLWMILIESILKLMFSQLMPAHSLDKNLFTRMPSCWGRCFKNYCFYLPNFMFSCSLLKKKLF
jgi:hypothetical protein